MNVQRLVTTGRWLFAIGLLGLGAEHFLFGDFVIGRAPAWPEGSPGRMPWAVTTGVIVIGAGASLLGRRWERPAMLTLAVMIFAWALTRHFPVVAASEMLAGTWTRAGKAVAFIGGSLVMAATSPPIIGVTGWIARYANATSAFIRIGALTLSGFLVVSGLQHFKFTPFVAMLIPAWFPGDPTILAQLAGIALIAGGVGLLLPPTTRMAALLVGVMLCSWFWIVHLPRTFVSVSDGIALFESLAFSGCAFVIAGSGQSARMAITGSTRVDRIAGARQATTATTSSVTPAATIDVVSRGETP